MADLTPVADENGTWVSLRRDNVPAFFAWLPRGAIAGQPFSIFWAGRASPQGMRRFFLEALPVVSDAAERRDLRASLYMPHAEVNTAIDPEGRGDASFEAALDRPDARFVRFELHRPPRDLGDATVGFSAWCRMFPPCADDFDETVGMSLEPQRLPGLLRACEGLITETRVRVFQPGEIRHLLNQLTEFVSPSATPARAAA